MQSQWLFWLGSALCVLGWILVPVAITMGELDEGKNSTRLTRFLSLASGVGTVIAALVGLILVALGWIAQLFHPLGWS